MAGRRTTLQIEAGTVQYLAKRGGRSHRGHVTFSRSKVLGRSLNALRFYQRETDPRLTRNLDARYHELIVRLLPEPWSLSSFEITALESVLAQVPDLAAAARTADVEPAAMIAAVACCTAVEKLTLVDHAIQHQAPVAAATSGGELAD